MSTPDKQRPKRLRDEMLVCERCGVSFLWSLEEQRQTEKSAEPSHCHGCRVLLPPPERERGLVKWYDPRKKYGFIIRPQAPELFTHRSQLQNVKRLQEGDLVEFRVVAGEKGPMAADVQVISDRSS